jgi:hypothetical protein
MFEIGSSLREARTRQGIDFPEMETRTKIRAKYLRLLEEDQFDQLPAPTYVKGFLRTYADALGLEGQLYVDEYNSRFVVGEEETTMRARRSAGPPTRSRARRRESRESRVVLLALAAIAIVTALVIAAWRFGGPSGEKVQGLSDAGGTPTVAVSRVSTTSSLVVRAVKGASYLEVRRNSRAGKPVFQGTLARGDVQRFTQRHLWLRITTPRNVVVLVHGRRLSVPRSGELDVATDSGR